MILKSLIKKKQSEITKYVFNCLLDTQKFFLLNE